MIAVVVTPGSGSPSAQPFETVPVIAVFETLMTPVGTVAASEHSSGSSKPLTIESRRVAVITSGSLTDPAATSTAVAPASPAIVRRSAVSVLVFAELLLLSPTTRAAAEDRPRRSISESVMTSVPLNFAAAAVPNWLRRARRTTTLLEAASASMPDPEPFPVSVTSLIELLPAYELMTRENAPLDVTRRIVAPDALSSMPNRFEPPDVVSATSSTVAPVPPTLIALTVVPPVISTPRFAIRLFAALPLSRLIPAYDALVWIVVSAGPAPTISIGLAAP